ncbi:MAG: elongation factor G [Acetobacteraceae bacterium]
MAEEQLKENSQGARHKPRAVALIGPFGSGKTTLLDALMAAAGTPLRRPGEARERQATTETRLAHATYLGDSWSILDCPGSVEFAFEMRAALAVSDLAVVVAEPVPSRAPALAPLFRLLEDEGLPFLLFLNRIDTLNVPLAECLAALQAEAKRPLVLRQVPIHDGENVSGYVDLASERAYRYRPGTASELIQIPSAVAADEHAAHETFLEALADHDDGLLEKVLEGVAPTPAEIYGRLQKDVAAGAIAGVLLGAAERNHGIQRLWKALRHDTPEPDETAARLSIDPAGPPLLQVFKTSYAGHAGKLSFARVWRGSIRDGATLAAGRIGGILRFPGNEAQKVAEAGEGELVALGRLDQVATGATLGGSGEKLLFPEPPKPVYSLAISTADRKDDVKLSGALQRLLEEDRSLSLAHEAATGETVLSGQGEVHLHAAIDRLSRAYGLKLVTIKPQVHFKETIRKAVHQHARLKRQTGGHGQFADVKLDIAPRQPGEGFLFVDRIVGGAVPRQYIPAVAEAAEESTKKGPFGYPVVDLSVTLVDGTFHSVDSSDMAFKTATRVGMTEALAKADPVLLEPIDKVTVSAPNSYTANVQRVLSGRRGRILGYHERSGWPGWDETEALVPEAELHDLIIELRSQTMGLGTFTKSFDHLAEAHARLAERLAREAASPQ